MTVALRNESGVAVDEQGLATLAQYVLSEMQVPSTTELSLVLVDEATMTTLHEQYMGEPGPTDVLAFPMDDITEEAAEGETDLIGDVVLCPVIAAAQALEAGHDTAAELRLLCTHGVLHLLGYDHHDPDEQREMFGLQARLLGSFSEMRVS
jgi:probable rRNA maturation factor